MQPRRISILGVGLLGGSIGLAVRERLKDCQIIGYAHRDATVAAALERGAVLEATSDPAFAVRGADLILLCSPVGTFESLMSSIGPHLSPAALVSDVGSTKRSVVAAAEKLLPPTVRFIGSHPMAGSEKRGVQFARADLFDSALCILTPTPATDPGTIQKMETFWRVLGMRTTRLSPAEHDRRLAEISHLPHAVAAALVAMQDEPSLSLAGKGFFDATRIAAGDAGLWRDIFIDNRDNLCESLRHFRQKLDDLATLLEPENAQALQAWLDAAATRRQRLAPRSDSTECDTNTSGK